MDLSLQRKLLQYLNLSTCAIKDFQKSGDFDLFEILDVGSNLQSEILTQTQKDSLPKSNLNKKQPPSLPYEILVKIFHLCCNHTLSNTCLVSKTWFQVSRNQIWSTIELAKEAQSETNAMLLSIAIKSSLAFCKTHSYWPALPPPRSIRINCGLERSLMSHFIKTIQLIDLSQLKDLLIEFELNSVEYNSDDDEDDEETKKNNLITSLREDIKCGTLGLLGKIDLETFFLNAVDIKLIKSKNKGILRKTLIKQLSHLSKLQKLVFNDRMSMQMVKMFPVCKKLTTIEFIWRREPDSRIFEILSTKFPNLTTIMINDEHGEHDFNPTLCISILAPQHLIINGHVKLDFSFLSSTKDSKLETFILKSTCTTHSNLIALFSGIGKSLTHCHIHKIECLEEDGDDGSETFYTVIDSIAKNVPKLESLMIDHSWKDVPLKIIESLCKKTKLKRLVKGMDLNELSESACTLFQKYGVDYGNWSLFGMFSSGIQDAFGRDFYNKFKSSGALSDFFETFQGVGGSQNDLDLITRLMSAIPIPETMQQLDFFHTEVLRQTQLQLNLQSSLAAQHSSGRVLVQPRTRQTASPLAIVSTTSTAPQTMSLTTSSTTMTLSTTSSTAAPLIPLTTSSTAAPLIPLTASSNAAQSSFTAQHHSSGRDLANPSASPTLPLIPLTTSSTTQLDFSSIDSSFFVFNAGASSTQQQPIQNVAGRPFARPRTRSISFTFPPAASPPAAKPQSPPDFTFDGSDAGFKF